MEQVTLLLRQGDQELGPSAWRTPGRCADETLGAGSPGGSRFPGRSGRGAPSSSPDSAELPIT